MNRSTVSAALCLAIVFGTSTRANEQSVASPYPSMAPIDGYLMPDRNAEIALARSAAPAAISEHASILVLGRRGYQTAIEGSNGFTCLVERSWMAPFDSPDFWNPKLRGPICYNPPAARSILPYTLNTTELALAGVPKSQIFERIRAAAVRRELPIPEPGAMSYMMAKQGYLGDEAKSWHPHLMFHLSKTEPAVWGANFPGSPVVFDQQYHEVPEPETIFMVLLPWWSDGTAAPYSADGMQM
jgi:hypothetical protein